MNISLVFVLTSAALGVGLAMDAFCVSMANGLAEPKMRKKRMCVIAGTFGAFQFAMPVIGWVCVHTIVEYFRAFETFIPWIALALLCFIGGKMIAEGAGGIDEEKEKSGPGAAALFIQGVATSIDALSVGFTIANYNAAMAVFASVLIAVVTFCICMCGILIGRKFGTRLSNKAQIFGGIILIAIGLEIFITGII